MYEIKMMNDDIFEVSRETALSLTGKSGLVGVKEISGMINMSSIVSITPKGLARNKTSETTRKCHDGSTAILKFGKWIDQYSGAELDLNYYPDLTGKEEQKLLE